MVCMNLSFKNFFHTKTTFCVHFLALTKKKNSRNRTFGIFKCLQISWKDAKNLQTHVRSMIKHSVTETCEVSVAWETSQKSIRGFSLCHLWGNNKISWSPEKAQSGTWLVSNLNSSTSEERILLEILFSSTSDKPNQFLGLKRSIS